MGGHLGKFSLVVAITAGVIFCPALLQLLSIPINSSLSIGVRGDLSQFGLMMPLLALMLAGPGLGKGMNTI